MSKILNSYGGFTATQIKNRAEIPASTFISIQFKNASGVVEAVLSQSGNLSAKGEITAFASI